MSGAEAVALHAQAPVLEHLSPARLRPESLQGVDHGVADEVDPGCDDRVDVVDGDHQVWPLLQQETTTSSSGVSSWATVSVLAERRSPTRHGMQMTLNWGSTSCTSFIPRREAPDRSTDASAPAP